jgi:DNA-directed RNA polymerase specialized sigma24 family protein
MRTEIEMMKMADDRQVADQKPTPYATGEDFCRIFEEDMNRLYLLSFLLTGDRSMSEKCFVRGLDDSAKGNPVFKDWARSWARRTIILNAIRMIRPRPADNSTPSSGFDRSPARATTEAAEITNIIELPAFERFAFVMSVLERHSDMECSLLLNCTRSEVLAARTRALQRIGRSAALRRQLAGVGSDVLELRDDPGAHPLHGILRFAASAW